MSEVQVAKSGSKVIRLEAGESGGNVEVWIESSVKQEISLAGDEVLFVTADNVRIVKAAGVKTYISR